MDKATFNSYGVLMCIIWLAIKTASSKDAETKQVHIWNDKSQFHLGGLFPVHTRNVNDEELCGEILRDKGIQRLEAMLYAIDLINNDTDFWKVSLGATVLDTCSSDSYALEQSLRFLQIGCNGIYGTSKRVTAVVGAANSPVSESVASIFRLFKIPQVSYASTSEELDNVYKYPFFFRVVPSDRFQVRAILDILHALKWTFVSTVASEGDYGEKAVKRLQEMARNYTLDEICFATVEIIPRGATEDDYYHVIKKLKQHDKARAVVVFLNEDKLKLLLSASASKNRGVRRFLWLGSDSWGAKSHPVQGQEHIADGAITVLPKRYPLEGFDKYFTCLRPSTNTRNPWFEEYWESRFNCVFDSSSRMSSKKATSICTGYEEYGDSYRQEGLVPMVVDAVFVIAYALKQLCFENPYRCVKGKLLPGTLVAEYIANVTFNSSQGHNMEIRFDANRDIPINYTIYQFRKVNAASKHFKYVPIGEWNPHSFLTLKEKPRWTFLADGTERSEIGRSSCSKLCKAGEERVRQQAHMRCCWICRQCEGDTYLPDPRQHCIACPTGYVPSINKTSCDWVQPDFLGRRVSSPWALFPILFSALGITITTVTIVVFILYRKTPLVMASGRELCHLILVGVILCYLFTFVVASKPTIISCGLLRVGLGLGPSLCYAAIFTKTNRVSRIFERAQRTVKRPPYISPQSQVMICLCLSLIQLTLSVLWLIVSPPTIRLLNVVHSRSVFLTCGVYSMSILLSFAYNMLLVILCTVYAFKTRNVPENFNEAKYISFAMYASCLVWVAFVIIYCSTWSDYKAQSTVLCLSVSMSGTVPLICLFFPKLYIILFRPHKNVRYPHASNSNDVTDVRFLRSAQSNETIVPPPSPDPRSKTLDHN